jgi:cell division protein FtsB
MNRAWIVISLFIITILLLQVKLQEHQINSLQRNNVQLTAENQKYVQQMTPLQMVQNGIYITDIERNEYLKAVWDYQNKFGK